MFSRIKRQAKNYYNAQADLAYVDSLFEDNANLTMPISFYEKTWLAQAERARTKISTASEKINKLGGAIREGHVYDERGQLISSRMIGAA